MRRLWSLCWLVCALSTGAVGAPCPNPAVLGPDPPGRQLSDAGRQAVLDELDSLVRRWALDPDFAGHGWAASFARARVQALAAADDKGFYRALRSLAVQLDDGHLNILSPAEVSAQAGFEGSGPDGPGEIGLRTEGLAGGQLRVQGVAPGGPADRAGLRPGDLILRVNGRCPQELPGPVGSRVQVTVQRSPEAARTLSLVREAAPADPYIDFGRLRADARVGYLRFDTFEPDQIGGRLQAALYLLTQPTREQPGPLRGLIVDLRRNSGGQLYELRRFLGIFVDGTVGSYRDRQGGTQPLDTLHAIGEAVDRLRGVPIAVLVSADTQSGGEVAAAVLRASRGAVVLGQRTPGLTSVASIFPLPDGSELELPTADLYLQGKRLAATGVVPDLILPITPPQAPDQDVAVQRALVALPAARR